jgi:tetratricopeptide (TPR) repeat protein
MEAGSYTEALSLFEQLRPHVLSRAAADTSRCLQNHAVALSALGRVEEAVGVLRETLSAFPEDYQASLKLASALGAAGRAQEAIEQFVDAVRLKNRVEYR